MLKQLMERWEKAFDEIELLSEYHRSAKTFKYATGSCFDLKNYTKENFSPENPLADTAPDDSVLYNEYGFDASGLPCYTSFPYNGSKSKWEGYYTYNGHLVEYVEFNIQTRVPSCIERVLFEGNRKISFQRIFINTRGSAPAYIDLPKEEKISRIKNDKYSIHVQIEEYEYDNDKIVKAECFGIAPGKGEYEFQKIFSYDKRGYLDEIRDFYPEGSSRLSYARPAENYDLQEISDRLASLIAESVVDTLVKNKVESPVAMVELGYQYVYTYLPVVISRPESLKQEVIEGGENIWEGLFLGFDDLLHLDTIKFERLFEQFMQIIENTKDYKIGTRMLRKSASLLTKNRLMGKIPVADEFFTYVIDHSVEGHSKDEFEEILKECGMEDNIIEDWNRRGWLRP